MLRTFNRPVGMAAIMIPAVAGVIFCALNAAGADLLCLSSGCDIYSGYTLGGLSIDLFGAAGFIVILALALLASFRPKSRSLLLYALIAGVFLDTIFLIWQVLYWPCTSCLVVAVLMALCLLGALTVFPSFRVKTVYLVLLLWFAAFMPVAAAAGKEILLPPWPVAGPSQAPVSVYFSPTCPTCEKTVRDIRDLPELEGQVAFYPVAKNAEDFRRLSKMMKMDEEGPLEMLFAPAAESSDLSLGPAMRWRLARNKMALARLGADRVPVVVTPRLVQAAPVSRPSPENTGGFPLEIFNFSPFEEGCSADTPAEDACD